MTKNKRKRVSKLKKREWQLTERQQNIAKNLMRQIDQVFDFRKKSGQGYRGKETYRNRNYEFAKFLAKYYNSQNFRNIREEHLQKFVEASRAFGVSETDIRNSLSAIRKLHELTPNTRYQLSNGYHANKAYNISKRKSRGIDRAWTEKEYNKAIQLAETTGRNDIIYSLSLARHNALRLEEVTALTYDQLRDSIRNGYIALKITKGGIARDVPLSPTSRAAINRIPKENPHGQGRIFTRHGFTHAQAIKSVQNWIYNNRAKFHDISVIHDLKYEQQLSINYQRGALTFHGLRHTKAREKYEFHINVGCSPKEARVAVAEFLGHGRDDVTRIYLYS
jgi:integrase/recombinase XerD